MAPGGTRLIIAMEAILANHGAIPRDIAYSYESTLLEAPMPTMPFAEGRWQGRPNKPAAACAICQHICAVWQ